MINKSLLVSIMLFIFSGCDFQFPIDAPSDKSDLDRYIQDITTQRPVVGVSLVVMEGEKQMKEVHAGTINLEMKKTPTRETRYQLASATKIFTGTLAMIYAERDSINLNDEIGLYLDEVPESWKSIKIKHLLTHTSGLPRMLNPDTGEMLGSTLAETYEKVLQKPLTTRPGKERSYNQLGFLLTGKILNEITGLKWEALLQKEIFDHLDMKNTGYRKIDDDSKSYSLLYTDEPEPFTYNYKVRQAGGIYTTTEDLVSFMRAIHSNRLFSKKSKEIMWSRVKLNDGIEEEYGIGWDMRSLNGQLTAGHSGGRKACITHFLESNLTVIFLTNTYGADPMQYVQPIYSVFN